MRLNMHIIPAVLFGTILAGLLSGCTIHTKENVARSATEFNLVAEKAGNEMLLLNIIRASKRQPMYFTSIGKLTRNMSFEYGTGDVSIPFGMIGKGLNGSYSIAPSASFNDSPLLDVSVLDSKEFTNGIMMPVPMETIGYYSSQGWHKEMLLHLFIRCIEIKNPDAPGGKEVYINYPGNRKKFECFQDKIRTEKWDIVVDRNTDATKIGEVNQEKAQIKMENLIEMHKAGLTLKNNKELHIGHEKYVFSYFNHKKGKIETIRPYASSGIRVYIRSPEAILYYLGEILRVENRKKDPYIPKIYAGLGECEGTKNWLFYARKAREEDINPCVSVEYDETRYVIPGKSDTKNGCCRDRSMHVLSLVSLLIGQQKKSELIPTTGLVNVIGR